MILLSLHSLFRVSASQKPGAFFVRSSRLFSFRPPEIRPQIYQRLSSKIFVLVCAFVTHASKTQLQCCDGTLTDRLPERSGCFHKVHLMLAFTTWTLAVPCLCDISIFYLCTKTKLIKQYFPMLCFYFYSIVAANILNSLLLSTN